MISLKPKAKVDESFVSIVERILNGTLRLDQFEEVYVVLIDNWFDHKWLEFHSSKIDSDELGWRAKLKIPPFEPSRVMEQLCFRKHTSGLSRYETCLSNPLHLSSGDRSLAEICSSGAFVWYSFVDNSSDRGSVMVYLNREGKGAAWYASFVRSPNWHINKVKGLSKRELTELLTTPVSANGI